MTQSTPSPGRLVPPFSALRVIEVAGSVAGAYAAKLFADFGAVVVKIEPPEGDPLRYVGPVVNGTGSLFALTNTGKRSLVLDLVGNPADAAKFSRLASGADVVIESYSAARSSALCTGLELPHAVRVCITPFGLSGPYARFQSSDFIDFAVSSHMFVNGDPDRPPLQGPPHESEFASGIHGFIGAIAALLARARTGRAQTVDIAHFEVMASLDQYTVPMWTHSRFIQHRAGNSSPGPFPLIVQVRCQDGALSITGAGARLPSMLEVMGLARLLEDPMFSDELAVLSHRQEFAAATAPWFFARTRGEVIELLDQIHIPAAPVRDIGDILQYEHLRARDFWQVPDEVTGVRYPRGPFIVSGHPARIRPAPTIDDADSETLALFAREPASSQSVASSAGATLAAGPLDGFRVLDLGSWWAGPLAARMLGDLGADVVRVEAPWARTRGAVDQPSPDPAAYKVGDGTSTGLWVQGMSALWGRNRRTVSMRLDLAASRDVVKRLVQRSDIVLENFTPRVMPKLGFSFEQLREWNPAIIYLHMPGYGTTGPDANSVSLGPTIEAAAGICSLMGYPDRGQHRQGNAFADAISGMSAAAGVMLALWDRAADPAHGARDVEEAQLEATVCFAGDALLATQVTGEEPALRGNRHPVHAPQGCYPADEPDSWIAISIHTDEQWRELSALASLPDHLVALSQDERRARHDEIDSAIAVWTRNHEKRELMLTLQQHGIAAGAVHNARELVEDPHLAQRHFYPTLRHDDYGVFPFGGAAFHFSETPVTYRIGSARLGEYNDEVLSEIGIDRDVIAALRRQEVISDGPAGR
jgi:crotonobetainyl-CoA:carnitine CoA-transferase CaiB-like acyl-CoA transferase